ncbi:histidine phosphatase family protein, partial [Pseudonocardia pini]|uniref:histidine phosphatase family protein n=1 Tax=Pseudonocardia pini TaxID=2758030 RepID=UPI0015F04F9B
MTLLVRHGESTWNAAGLLQGSTQTVGLTARGRAQARAAADWIRVPPATRILTSPQLRATETARILAEHLGLPVHECLELREQAHG